METLLSFPRRGLSNLTGLLKVKLIEVEQVLAVMEPARYPDAATLVIGHALPVSGLVLTPGAQFTEVWFPPGAASFAEKWDDGPQGQSWAQMVGFSIPRHHPENSDALRRLAGRRYLAVVLDTNNQARLVGMPRQPLRLMNLEATSAGANSMVGLSTVVPVPAYFLPGYSDAALFGSGADFSSRSFSFTFKRY